LAKGRITAQQLKRDPLMEQYLATSEWVKQRLRPITTGLIVVVVVVAAIIIFQLISSSRKRAAQEALAVAFRHEQAVVANPLPPTSQGLAFTTEEEKHKRTYEAFDKVAREYPSFYGELARYYAATHQLYFDPTKAEATLQELAQKESSVGAQARLALAQRYETTGRFEQALAEYQKLKAKPLDIPLLQIDFNMARTYEAMGKTREASDLYFSVAQQAIGQSLGTSAATRLTLLDPVRAEQLPEPPKSGMPSFGGLSLR
jgi:tetratricopeptide (TPR) repeat protein